MTQGVHMDMGASATLDFDVQLMLRVRDGDEDSFKLLLDKHRNALVFFLHRMVQDQAVAEELAQEVFFRVYRSRGTYEPTAKFTTWLFRIATHLALNSLRNGKHDRRQERLDDDRKGAADGFRLADQTPSAEQGMVREARFQEVRDAIAMLPGKQRAAVLMHKYEEMDYAQIAKALDSSESAVKSLLFRAYESLRARLAHMAAGGIR